MFGRDEDDSGMELRQADVDEALRLQLMFLDGPLGFFPLQSRWSEVVLNIR